MIFNVNDILTIIKIFIYFFIVSALFYFPLLVFFKDRRTALKLSIPISWSVQIIFGYIFYVSGIPNLYMYFYFPLIVLANIFAYIKLKDKKVPKDVSEEKVRWFFYLFIFLYTVLAIYYRFYDSVKFVGPGNPDTIAHVTMLKDVLTRGFIFNSFYAPGFHLLLTPLAHITDLYDLSRFAGPVISLFTLSGLYLLFKDRIKLSSGLLLLVLLSFPFFGKFIIQTIGFFPTALSFLLFSTLLVFFFQIKNNIKLYYYLNLLIVLALAVTVPYFFVQYILFLFILYLIILIASRTEKKNFNMTKKKIIASLIVLFIGYTVAFGHVILETQIVRKTSFPTIRTIQLTDSGLSASDNYESEQDINIACSSSEKMFAKRLVCSYLSKSILIPLVNTAIDAFKFKTVLPLKGLMNLGSYLVCLLAVLSVFYSIKKERLDILVLSASTFVYGFCTVTGFFEMSDYRGRSGWYFFLSTILSVAIYFDFINKSKRTTLVKYIILVLLFISSILLAIKTPMVFPRLFYPEVYSVVNEIVDKQDSNIALISTTDNLATLDKKITLLEFNLSQVDNDYPASIVVIEKIPFDPNNTYKNVVFAHNWDVEKRDQKVIKKKEEIAQTMKLIAESPQLKNYALYFENQNIAVFTKPAL